MQGGSFLNFKDMFDGGGAGAAGKEFSGGGLLSDLANAFFTPFGQGARMQEAMQNTRPQMRPQQPTMGTSGALPAPKQYSGRGDYGMMPPRQPGPNSMTPDANDPRGNYWGGQPSPYARPTAASTPPQQPMQPVADPMAPYMPPLTPDAIPVQNHGSMTGLTAPGSMTAPGYMGHDGQTKMSPEMFEVMKWILQNNK